MEFETFILKPVSCEEPSVMILYNMRVNRMEPTESLTYYNIHIYIYIYIQREREREREILSTQ